MDGIQAVVQGLCLTPMGEARMLSQDQWGAIRAMTARGLSKKAIARELGIDVKTVRNYLRRGQRERYRRRSPVQEAIERDHGDYLRRRAPEVNWSVQVLFQELRRRDYPGSYETVKRWIRPLREQEAALAEATLRFETGPGRQSQVDWGSTKIVIGGEQRRAHLFIMTLCFSRRGFARAYPHERLAALIDGHEQAFAHFGGRTQEILYDNPRTIVLRRDAEGKHIDWNPTFRDFSDRYGFATRLCRPYRAQTKGKVESGVKYVKRNALVGRSFETWDHLNAWLLEWTLTIADQRIHGTTHEKPADRFAHEVLVPVRGIAAYRIEGSPVRRVPSDALVSLDTNRYSVPWRLAGKRVEVAVLAHQVRIYHCGAVVAAHELCSGRHQVVIDPEHFKGLLRTARKERAAVVAMPDVLWGMGATDVEVRDLAVYEAVAIGGAR